MNNRREEDEKTKSEKAIHGKCDEELVEVEYDVDEEVMEMKTLMKNRCTRRKRDWMRDSAPGSIDEQAEKLGERKVVFICPKYPTSTLHRLRVFNHRTCSMVDSATSLHFDNGNTGSTG